MIINLESINIESFKQALKEVISQGYGEVTYKIVVQKGKVEFITLTKTNTFKPESDIIKI